MDFFERYAPYLKHLVWPGITLVTAGLVAGSIVDWTLLPIALLLGGLLLIGGGIYCGGYTSGGFWRRRSTQASTNALISAVALMVILALINFVAVRYSGRLDLTENQRFTLAPQSKTLVQQLGQPVQVAIFDGVLNPEDQYLLESYRRQNPGAFSFDAIDPFADPITSQQFGVETPGEVYLVVGDKRQFVQRVNEAERLSERQLTNALDQITRDRDTVIYFLQGHGEYPIDGTEAGMFEAARTLEGKNYTVKPLNFDQGATDPLVPLLEEDPDSLDNPDDLTNPDETASPEVDGLSDDADADADADADVDPDAAPAQINDAPKIPEDAGVVILAGPQQSLFESEAKALEAYLDNGGNALILVDPNSPSGVETLLSGWGVTLDGRLVIDTSGTGQLVGLGPAAPLVTNYGDHPITQDFANGRSFFPVVQPIAFDQVPGITAEALLYTAEQSQVGTISDAGELDFNPETAEQGPFIIGAALNRTIEIDPDLPSVDDDAISDEAGSDGEASAPAVSETDGDVSDADVSDADVSDANANGADASGADANANANANGDDADASGADANASGADANANGADANANGADANASGADANASGADANANGADANANGANANGDDANASDTDSNDDIDSETEPSETVVNAPEASENTPEETAAIEAPFETVESRLVVIGNSSFATDGLFDQQLNGDVFLNAISWLSQDSDATLSISPKETTMRRILMTPQQQASLGAFALLIMPLVGIVGAIVMWLRRR